MKINFKLGGVNHILPLEADQSRWFGAFPETMVVGADVTHSTQGDGSKHPSLAGVVATYNGNGHYLGSARLQESNTEVSKSYPIARKH